MTVSDEIIKVLDALGEKVGVIIDWTADNVVPYVEQLCNKYVKWEISTSIAWIVMAVVITILMYVIGGLCEIEDLIAIAVIATLITIVIVGVQVFDIIECKVFPEKVIFEKVSEMIKSAKQ